MKKLRPEVEESIKNSNYDLFGMLDQALFTAFNITEDELQFIHDNASDEELQTFVGGLGRYNEAPLFSEIRKSLQIRNKYLKLKNTK